MQFAKLTAVALATAFIGSTAQGASQNYVYVPVDGVHEVKTFHACYDDTDATHRSGVTLIMQGLSRNDVTVETRPLAPNKPSSELLTFRLKKRNASMTAQFRSDDGAHCQQGVEKIVFTDAQFAKFSDLNVRR
ncbi:MAG: hypothetical protein M3N23_07375 [Pseudomonadota bacterium]|nr:hypothetical protein [Pseudomonadota bacterium]